MLWLKLTATTMKHIKHLLFLSILCSLVLFTNCGEDEDANTVLDADRDGVADADDTCADTPSGETVDSSGCSDSQKDTDGDGVTDDLDTCADTPEGTTVDENGCALPAIYLDDNGVTIKASANATIGDSYDLDGVSYLVVDEATLKAMVAAYEDVTKVVTTNVTNMEVMFQADRYNRQDTFNLDIGSWDVSNVTNMAFMFNYAPTFNQDIGSWDVSKVMNMKWMFADAKAFNQDIGSWDVSNVWDMNKMFNYASDFNQNISSWDVSSVSDMQYMFARAKAFNQDIGSWDVSSVFAMSNMFLNAESFNQDLSSWSVSDVLYCTDFSTDATAWTLPKPTFTKCTE